MSHNYHCIIIDDEPRAAELLKDSLTIVNKKLVVDGIFTNWSAALEAIRSQYCDILFLDIDIQGRNGMDLLRSVPDLQCELIFVTAHSGYALNAFKFPTTGYLLKPVDEIELATTVDRAIARVEQKRKASATATQPSGKIGIPDSKSVNYVDTRSILYLESFNSYTKVVTREREILSSYNIGRFRDLLPATLFYQVHRSFIVNLDAISRYEHAGTIVLENGKDIPVSKSVRSDLLALFARVRTSESATGKS